MANIDFNRVMLLLNTVEKVSTVSPGYVHISSEAMAELREVDEYIRVQREKAQGKPVTPPPVGAPNSPPPTMSSEAQSSGQVVDKPTATPPLESAVKAKREVIEGVPGPAEAAPPAPKAIPSSDQPLDAPSDVSIAETKRI